MKNCTKECPIKKCLLPALAVFFFMMAYETFIDGFVLSGIYKQTAAVWRPDVQMNHLWFWLLLHVAALAAVIACLFSRFSEKKSGSCAMTGEGMVTDKPECPYSRGICFGVKIGLILGLMHSRQYAWIPIPVTLAIGWFVTAVIEGVGIGLILSEVERKYGTDKQA